MNHLKRTIRLKDKERKQLKEMLHKGKWKSKELRKARVLLLADGSDRSNADLAKECGFHEGTITLIKKRYTQGGLAEAVFDNPRSGAPHRLDEKEEAWIIATACSEAPDGYDHWTLALHAKHFEKKRHKHIGTATVYRVELKNTLKPWQKKRMGGSLS